MYNRSFLHSLSLSWDSTKIDSFLRLVKKLKRKRILFFFWYPISSPVNKLIIWFNNESNSLRTIIHLKWIYLKSNHITLTLYGTPSFNYYLPFFPLFFFNLIKFIACNLWHSHLNTPLLHTKFYRDPQCHHKCQKFTYQQCITFAELLNHLKNIWTYSYIPNHLNTQLYRLNTRIPFTKKKILDVT